MVKEFPRFESGMVLRQKMLSSLADYVCQLGNLQYQDFSDGIVRGCALTTTADSIIVNPGIVRYEGELYLLNEPLMCDYSPTDSTRVLQMVFHDKVTSQTFISREIGLCFTDEDVQNRQYMELCRFKLQPKARLRYQYTSFEDRETEYDTLNIIHSPFCGLGFPTLHPDIVRHFASEALKGGADGMDSAFCLQILAQQEPVQRVALQTYVRKKLGDNTVCDTNLQLYHGLLKCLGQLETKRTEIPKASKGWQIMVD